MAEAPNSDAAVAGRLQALLDDLDTLYRQWISEGFDSQQYAAQLRPLIVSVRAALQEAPHAPLKADDRALAVTRFEVIGPSGRIDVYRPCEIELSFQDNDRTLKVFVNRADLRGGEAPHAHPETDLTLAQALSHWFTQGGEAQFGALVFSGREPQNADELMSAILARVRERA